MKPLLTELRTALVATLCLAVVVCGFYPGLVWALAQALFSDKANGSFVEIENRPVGSLLIGQPFAETKYFHPRPSAAGAGYDATNSSGTNLGPMSKKLIEDVAARVARYRELNGLEPDVPIPADAVTASASGLDPDVSLENALLQAPRVARARGMNLDDVKQKIQIYTQDRQFGIFGEQRVNVLLLNLALDGKL